LPRIALFPITAIARDWDDAQQKFFADNGIIDAILREPHP
jgi:sulfate transport system substrate-binding protein